MDPVNLFFVIVWIASGVMGRSDVPGVERMSALHVATGKCLDMNQNRATISACNSGKSQQFAVLPGSKRDSGRVMPLTNVGSKMCLGMANGMLKLTSCDTQNQDAISFKTPSFTTANGETRYLIKNVHSGECLRPDEDGKRPFIRAVTCNQKDKQQHFVPPKTKTSKQDAS